MIDLKTPEEIATMQKGGVILHKILTRLLSGANPGVTLSHLDKLAGELMKKNGVRPSFKMVKGYRWNICTCINDVVVHGIPDNYSLQEGDLIGIDCGVFFEGFHTDHAWTKIIGDGQKEDISVKKRFLEVGQNALKNAIEQVQPGNYIYDISKAIQDTVETGGYSVVRSLVGHGVGRLLHEEPEVPGFVQRKRESYPKIIPGMVLAIEVIYNLGSPDIISKGDDGWTIATKDGKISGLFEVTVGVSSHGCIVLT